jgi:hypothetical protein
MSKDSKAKDPDNIGKPSNVKIEKYTGKWATSWWSHWILGVSYGTCSADIPNEVPKIHTVIPVTFVYNGTYLRGSTVTIKLRVEKVYQSKFDPTMFTLTVVSNNPNFSFHNVICQDVEGRPHYSGNYKTKNPPDDGTFSF